MNEYECNKIDIFFTIEQMVFISSSLSKTGLG